MKKNKKPKSKKQTSLFGGATKSIKKLGKGTANGLGGLSTTQKVVGGAALLALGLSYWNKRRGLKATTPDATTAEQHLNALDGNPESQV